MREPKRPNMVRGNRIRCPKFIQCPVCYGCRAYSTSDLDCNECANEDKRKNICNLELHNVQVLSDFSNRPVIEVNNVTFK